jgi:hypothetical protein
MKSLLASFLVLKQEVRDKRIAYFTFSPTIAVLELRLSVPEFQTSADFYWNSVQKLTSGALSSN